MRIQYDLIHLSWEKERSLHILFSILVNETIIRPTMQWFDKVVRLIVMVVALVVVVVVMGWWWR